MGWYVETDKIAKAVKDKLLPQSVMINDIVQRIIEEADEDSVKFTRCTDCTECVEQGGHANCAGYLFCRRERKLVTETDGCSWGVER